MMLALKDSTAILAWSALFVLISGNRLSSEQIRRKRQHNTAELKARAEAPIIAGSHPQDFRFLTHTTERKIALLSDLPMLNPSVIAYQVTSLPDVAFDIGEMYAGLIPINAHDTSRALYFVYQPTIGDPVDEVTIWLNGGPG